MRTLILVLISMSLAVACGDDAGGTDAGRDGGTDAAADVPLDMGATDVGPMVTLNTGWREDGMSPIEGVTVEIYDVADFDTPIGTGTTDAEGFAAIAVPMGSYDWAARASQAGFKDTWYVHSAPATEDHTFGNLVIFSEGSAPLVAAAAGVTLDPARGLVIALSVPMMTMTADVEGTIVYLDDGNQPDPSLTMTSASSGAVLFNAPPGEATCTVVNETQTGMRTFPVFVDSLTIGSIPITDL